MKIFVLLIIIIPLMLSAQIDNFQWPLVDNRGGTNAQHRISATFDEFRDTAPADHFHNGTDMPLAPGEPVLSIMAGTVDAIGSDWIRVEDFAYVHVIPLSGLLVGQSVAKEGVVGHTDSYAHIHLNYGADIRDASDNSLRNPLLPGKITPFSDPYHPRSPIIQLVKDGTNISFPSKTISGHVDIIAQAADTTDIWAAIDKNNGVYKIGWALFSADKSTVLEGPHYWFEANQLYSNTYVHLRYAPGSSTSIYRHIVTNKPTSNGYLDCTLYDPGEYVIAVMSSDTRDNWDTTYVPITISDQDLLPPAQPDLSYVGPDGNGGLLIEWTPVTDPDLRGYRLEFSFDGNTWTSNHGPDLLTADMSSYTFANFSGSSYMQFRLQAVDIAPIPNYSEYSDTYGVRMNKGDDKILIVDGFDRISGSWDKSQHNFATYYASAVVNSGSTADISTAGNEWITAKGSLEEYDVVIWFTGDDSRTDESFSTLEQTIIRNYLSSAGHHFVASGSEIAYDLYLNITAGDKAFMNQVLHLDFGGDNSGSLHADGYGPDFSGLSFDYGANPYLEDWPDYFNTAEQGEIVLKYGNGLTAGVGYRSGGIASLVIGFPFETIDSDDSRSMFMEKILDYFAATDAIEPEQNPVTSNISVIYPNPFNASVNVGYRLEQAGPVLISVFDIRGKLVYEEQMDKPSPGNYLWRWDARDSNGKSLSSGSYMIRLNLNDGNSSTRKTLLLK
ncbi:MAG: T9SS type A sorting domain-containing protein [Candidatus Marinimicrobia bacterium]|nr:T9SS type A sorting domain-containing protein [Candidatus Neomarinimicrobiota bacterium]